MDCSLRWWWYSFKIFFSWVAFGFLFFLLTCVWCASENVESFEEKKGEVVGRSSKRENDDEDVRIVWFVQDPITHQNTYIFFLRTFFSISSVYVTNNSRRRRKVSLVNTLIYKNVTFSKKKIKMQQTQLIFLRCAGKIPFSLKCYSWFLWPNRPHFKWPSYQNHTHYFPKKKAYLSSLACLNQK